MDWLLEHWQSVAAPAIVVVAAVWLLRGALRRKRSCGGCEGCGVARGPADRR